MRFALCGNAFYVIQASIPDFSNWREYSIICFVSLVHTGPLWKALRWAELSCYIIIIIIVVVVVVFIVITIDQSFKIVKILVIRMWTMLWSQPSRPYMAQLVFVIRRQPRNDPNCLAPLVRNLKNIVWEVKLWLLFRYSHGSWFWILNLKLTL